MSRLIVSLKARADTSDIIKDLANKAGYGVAAASPLFVGSMNDWRSFPTAARGAPSLGRARTFVSFRRTSSFTNTMEADDTVVVFAHRSRTSQNRTENF